MGKIGDKKEKLAKVASSSTTKGRQTQVLIMTVGRCCARAGASVYSVSRLLIDRNR